MTAVENKISDVTNLVKKTYYDINITEVKISDHDKYITTSEFNKLTTENFAARLAQANLVTKTDFDNKLTGFNKRNNSSKTKHLLTENEFKKLQKIDSSYFRRKSHFVDSDSTQNYFVFQPVFRYLKKGLAILIMF